MKRRDFLAATATIPVIGATNLLTENKYLADLPPLEDQIAEIVAQPAMIASDFIRISYNQSKMGTKYFTVTSYLKSRWTLGMACNPSDDEIEQFTFTILSYKDISSVYRVPISASDAIKFHLVHQIANIMIGKIGLTWNNPVYPYFNKEPSIILDTNSARAQSAIQLFKCLCVSSMNRNRAIYNWNGVYRSIYPQIERIYP